VRAYLSRFNNNFKYDNNNFYNILHEHRNFVNWIAESGLVSKRDFEILTKLQFNASKIAIGCSVADKCYMPYFVVRLV